MPQFGKICSLEYVIKAGLCRRLCRRVNMIASRNPVKAPRNASEIERLLKVRSPWPVRRNPAYAIATVQRIARTGCMGNYLSMNKYCHNSRLRVSIHSRPIQNGFQPHSRSAAGRARGTVIEENWLRTKTRCSHCFRPSESCPLPIPE